MIKSYNGIPSHELIVIRNINGHINFSVGKIYDNCDKNSNLPSCVLDKAQVKKLIKDLQEMVKEK